MRIRSRPQRRFLFGGHKRRGSASLTKQKRRSSAALHNAPGFAMLSRCDSRSRRATSAFTLIELVISSAIMAIILASAYACLQAGLSSRKLIETRSDIAQTARVAMSLLAADLRSACVLSEDFEFLGMSRMIEDVEADNLDFATHNYSPRARHEGDFCEVSYFVAKDPDSDEFSLWRRRDSSPDPEPLAGGGREEIARGVRGVKFEFYDGFDWYDDWGDADGQKQESSLLLQPNLSGMPDAVRITLLFARGKPPTESTESPAATGKKPEEAPLTFQTVVRLNLAPIERTSSSTSSSGSSGAENSSGTPGQSGGNSTQPNQ